MIIAIALLAIVAFFAGGAIVYAYFPRIETKVERVVEQGKAEVEAIPADVLSIVHDVETRFAEASGEAKRHQALALLIKAGYTERKAAQWIEKAVEHLCV